MEGYTRTEQYLNGILNGTPVPEPYTREEKLLAAIAQKESGGGGGGGGAGDFVAELTMEEGSISSMTTFQDIAEAYDQGKSIKAVIKGTETGDIWFYLAMYLEGVQASFFGYLGELILISCNSSHWYIGN